MNTSSKTPQRHCMVVHNYYPLGEPRVQRQAEALVAAGIEVDVICLRNRDEAPRAVAAGVNVYRVPVARDKNRGPVAQFFEYLAFFILAFARVSLLHLLRRYDVVQVHNLPDFLVFAAAVPRLLGAAVILDLHDLMPEFYMSRFRRGPEALPVRLILWQERVSCRFATHVITVSSLWRQDLIRRGVPAAKCSVVMNLPDDRIFKADVTPAPRPEGFHLFYHGNLTHRYGVDLALRALAEVRADIPDVFMTIHGRGEFLQTLQELCRQLDLEDIVRFSTGLLPMEALPALIASADVAVVPYRRDVFTDGILPTKLMEYAALGIPTIVARTPVIEAYFDEDMVAYFDAEDIGQLAGHIRSLYRDPERRRVLAGNIRRFTATYHWAKQKAEYVALVRRLAAT
ncbi:MAG: glycosyltransferase WbuB [Caldilineae bacterium]|nr:MAG: glycosyltransferase WbuB [Caldilineae bacterium]